MGRLRREEAFISAYLPSVGVVDETGVLRPILKALTIPKTMGKFSSTALMPLQRWFTEDGHLSQPVGRAVYRAPRMCSVLHKPRMWHVAQGWVLVGHEIPCTDMCMCALLCWVNRILSLLRQNKNGSVCGSSSQLQAVPWG